MSAMKISTEEFLLNTVSVAFIFTSTFVLLPLRRGIDSRFVVDMAFLLVGALVLLLSRRVDLGILDSFLAVTRRRLTSSLSARWRKVLMPISIYVFAFLLLVFRVLRMGASVDFDEPLHLELTKSFATFDLGSWIEAFAVDPIRRLNPPLPYFLMAILLRPLDFPLFAGRLILCLFAAIIPVVLLYMAREVCVESTTAIAVPFAYTLSTLYQGALFKYDFDALSTLFFTLCVYSFIVAMNRKQRLYFGYSMIAWILLILTKYPPAGWLFLGFMLTSFFHKELRSHLGFILLALLVALLMVVAVLPAQLGYVAEFFIKMEPMSMEYAVPLFRDFAVVIGWSPYLAIAFKLKEAVKGTRDLISTFSVVLIILAFISPIIYPLTRRVIQVIPLLVMTLANFSTGRWSRTTSLLILMNVCWWEVIRLPYL